ncbi:transcriptional regulator, TrmB [Ignisphaera aggregans DSM 17230]|uniref:Transcriptional regulator, TrmB n=1 Tax=Ignisphaera aggregans (strain DSM 17230 / JCM 13409 / AQ1.S1) TaxID=583356 RepID=E0SS10_IGNAA|nr:transcriptional regulator, TrmB [Ignisphaera aggregans DSM 17230]
MSRPQDDLSRTALKIYLYLLESKDPQGVREISRALNIPVSTVHYHMKKLLSLGIVREDSYGYRVSRVINIDGFIVFRQKLIPRLMVYAMFFIGLLIGEILLISIDGFNSDRLLMIIITIVSISIFILESINTKKSILR